MYCVQSNKGTFLKNIMLNEIKSTYIHIIELNEIKLLSSMKQNVHSLKLNSMKSKCRYIKIVALNEIKRKNIKTMSSMK